MKNEKGISLIVLLVILVLAVVALAVVFRGNSNNGSNISSSKNKSYGLGDTITFDGLELTFDTTYSFDTVASTITTDYNGTYIKLGANIKNVSNEKNALNMLYFSFFGSNGTKLTGIAGYFKDSIETLGELKPSASAKSYFYIPYDGNGNYSIDFHKSSQEISVEFNVTQ